MFLDAEFYQTPVISNTSNPDFDYVRTFSFKTVTRQLVDYLKDGFIVLMVYGKQIAKPNNNNLSNYQLMQRFSRNKTNSDESESVVSNQNLTESNENDKQTLVLELMSIRRQKVKLQQRIVSIQIKT